MILSPPWLKYYRAPSKTITTIAMTLSPKTYTTLCACFAAFGSLTYGYDLGIIAGILEAQDFLQTTKHPSPNYLGFITSSMLLGAFVGCIPASICADIFSRRYAITVWALVFIIGAIIQAATINREMMMAGRFITGLGIGGLVMLTPLYQSEIAHPSMRGRLTTLVQLSLGVGALLASFMNLGLKIHNDHTEFQWRFALAFQIAPAIPLVCCTFVLPESPRWLMMHARKEEAQKVLADLHANGDLDDIFVLSEMVELENAVHRERELERRHGSWLSLFTEAQSARKVLLGIALQFSGQMTGVSAIQYYSPSIFASIGFSVTRSLLFAAIANIFALFGEVLCLLYIDKLGRRLPLIICNVGAGVTFIVGTVLLATFPITTNANISASYAFVIMTWIFQIFFSAGIGPLCWIYPVEILSTGIRAKGSAITTMASTIAAFMIGQVTPIAIANIGWRYYILFAICGFSNALGVYLFFPETNGRTLEEMDLFFAQTPLIITKYTGKMNDTPWTEPEVISLERGGIGKEEYNDGKGTVQVSDSKDVQAIV